MHQDLGSIDSQVESIRSRIRGFRQIQLYVAFAELDLGSALDDASRSVEELSQMIEADESALLRYLNAATALGLIERSGADHFQLTDLGRAMYAPSSDTSLNNAIKLEGAFYHRWGRLTEGIRSGGRPEANRAQEDDPGWVRMFTLALFENSRKAARAAASTVNGILPQSAGRELTILDLGGGHGGYSIALSEHRPHARITVFDLPPVIEVTCEIVAMHNKANQIDTVPGDFHQDSIGSNFDAIMLFGVLHGETPENAPRLLATIREALAPDGLLLIRSQGTSTDRGMQGERELMDLHMMLSTEGGKVRRARDTEQLVTNAGFTLQQSIDIESPGSGSILVFSRD